MTTESLTVQSLDVDISLVSPNGFNPRQTFAEEALAELAESIRQHGILEALVVRIHHPAPIDQAKIAKELRHHGLPDIHRELVCRDLENVVKAGGRAYVYHASYGGSEVYRDEALKMGLDLEFGETHSAGSVLVSARPLDKPRYDLIAGERRLRAAKLAGLTVVPVRVVDVDDWTAHELALIENLVREDLDPIETAQGMKRLADLGVKQAEIGRRIGRSQPVVANTLRLLTLPADVQERIRTGELSTAHGVSLARFHEFPEACSVIAESAAGTKLTSKQLDADPLPFPYVLESKGLIRAVPFYESFGKTDCERCPFDAYRKSPWSGYCLRPDHYQALKAEADKERQAELKAKIAGAQGVAAVDGEDLPVVDRLEYGTYEDLDNGLDRHGHAPTGCRLTECPSYQRVIRHGRAATLCMDPKCFKRLSIAQTKAANKARKLAIQNRAKALATATKPLTEIGPRETAIIAAYALSCVETDAIAEAAKGRGLPENARIRPDANTTKVMLERYAQLDPRDLLLAVVEAIVQGEAKNELASDYVYGRVNLHAGEWYVGQGPSEREASLVEMLTTPATEPVGIPTL
jgi:ParB/RepB/Spo0J family partition protein